MIVFRTVVDCIGCEAHSELLLFPPKNKNGKHLKLSIDRLIMDENQNVDNIARHPVDTLTIKNTAAKKQTCHWWTVDKW